MIRFWSKVDKDGPIPPHLPKLGNCWMWTSGKDKDGYGIFHLKSHKAVRAHRLAFQLEGHDIPPKAWVLHRCDNPSCVRPSHLFVGNAFDNIHDCLDKGRGNRALGERVGTSRLTSEQVQIIRREASEGIFHKDLADRFGVCRSAISLLVESRTWKHIP